MPETHFKVSIESDHIKRLTTAKPIPALAELIWNACDGDATRIDVEIDRNELGMTASYTLLPSRCYPHPDWQRVDPSADPTDGTICFLSRIAL